MAWLRARDRWSRFEFLPYQSADARRRYPALEPEVLAQEMHVVAPDGVVRTGVDAAPWVFGNLPGWRWLARILGWPVARIVARPLYARIAASRRLFNQGGACARSGENPQRPA